MHWHECPQHFWEGGGCQDRLRGCHLTVEYDWGEEGCYPLSADSERTALARWEGKGVHVPTCSSTEHLTFYYKCVCVCGGGGVHSIVIRGGGRLAPHPPCPLGP